MTSKFAFSLAGTIAALTLAVPARAQAVLTLVGAGSDSGISFQFLTNGLLTTPSLTTQFVSVPPDSCTVPAGESCTGGVGEISWDGAGGIVRLTTQKGGSPLSRTWSFPAYLHNGVYISGASNGFEPAGSILIVSGVDGTAGEPQSNATSAQFQFPLEATVTDTTPATLSGATVTFTAPPSGPSATLPNSGQATTDSTGRATITPTANGTAGAYQITASATVGGFSVQYAFTVANVNTIANSGSCQVSTSADDFSAGSLRYVIAACGQGSTITFANGVAPTVQFEPIPLTQDITIDGGSGVTISGNNSRLFFIQGGTITLKNLTLQNGQASGGAGGDGSQGGGGAAGMGGAIFQNGGTLNISNVTFENNVANGGSGGSTAVGSFARAGGGGIGVLGGSSISTGGNGGGGGPFGTRGGGGDNSGAGGAAAGSGAGGGGGVSAGGAGAFGGGGGVPNGAGGLGGGSAGTGLPGDFGGSGASGSAGGGGAGLGGAIFVNAGTLSLVNATFTSNTASSGSGGGGAAAGGQAKGGALYISSAASAGYTGTAPAFSHNVAADAGINTLCSAVTGPSSLDTQNVCGILTNNNANHFSVSTSLSSTTAGSLMSVTVTALNSSNATDTGYTGTIHFNSNTDASAVVPSNYTFVVGDAGVHTFTNLLSFHTAGTQTVTATDTVTTSITGTSNNVTVSAGPVTSITVSAASPQIPGVAFNLSVSLKDQFSNAIASSADTFHFTSTDSAASLPANGLLVSGTVSVTLNTKGNQTITVTDTTVSVSQTSSTILVTAPPPTLTASFSPTTVAVGGTRTTTLTLTVTNPGTTTLTGIAFSNTYPAGLTVDAVGTDNCTTGSRTFVPSGITVTGVTLAAGASCTESVLMHATVTGSFTDTTSTVTATESMTAGVTASATLSAGTAPTLSAAFVPTSVTAGGNATLTFTVTNPNTALSLTNLTFSDTLPAGLAVATPNGQAGSCGGGAITATAGSGTVSLSGATLASGGSCTFSVNATASSTGTKVNTTSTVTSNEGLTGSAGTATLTVTPGPATHFSVLAPASATAGTAFSITVTALDAGSNTATAYSGSVHFTSPDGLATLPANSTLTNGVGTFSVTLKTAGTQTVTATDAISISITGTSNGITVSGTGATHFSLSAPSAATAGTAFNFTITALDQFNNTVPGYAGTVHFTSGDGLATLPANSTLTNGAGTFSATLRTAGTQNITATDTATTSIQGASNNITVSAAAATHLVVSAPGTATPGTAFNLTVTALDPFGNTATSYAGTVHFASADGAATLPANSTLTNGVATFAATLRTTGSQTVTATDTVTTSITGTSNAIVVGSGAATRFLVSVPSASTAGTAFNFTVTALDQFSNTVTGYAGTVHFTSSDGQATLPANSTLTNGVGTFSATLKTAGNQMLTATDTVTASITGTSTAIVVSGGAATHFTISAPGSATAGTAFNFTVTALDPFNNTATGYAGRVHFTSSDAQATLPADTTLTNGVSTFSVTLKTAGSQTLIATDTVTPSITGTSAPIVVSGSAATHFSVSAPSSATAGGAFNFTVTALDAFNNTASGYAGTAHFTSSDGQATLPANSTLANGVGIFSAALKIMGGQTLTATDTVTPSIAGTSGPINVSAGATTHFSVSAPGSTTAGTAFNFTVAAQDQFNNTVTGYAGTVHFASSDGQAVLPANSTLSSGVGTFSTTLKTAGSQTLTATDTTTVSITGTSNTISVLAGPATHFTVSAPGTVTLNSPFNFTVTAEDAFNNTAMAYTGTVRFTSSDGQALLPANSTLMSGTGTFSATLKAGGAQTITATDSVNGSITGVSGAILASLTTILTSPSGLTIMVDGASYTSPQSFSFAPGTNHTIAVSSPQAGPSGTQYVFTGWSDGGAASHSIAIPANGAETVTATFKTQYLLATGASGGGSVTPATNFFDAGSTVTLTAYPNAGYRFLNWSGPVASSTNFHTTVVMTGPLTVTANFGVGSLGPAITPTSASLQYFQGTDASKLTVQVTVNSMPSESFTTASTAPWLSVSGPSQTTAQVVVSANPTGLTPGTYTGNVLFTFADGTVLSFQMQLSISASAGPQLTATPGSLSFTEMVGATAAQSQTLSIGSTVQSVPVSLSASSSGNWLSASTTATATPASAQVQVNATGLAAGTYQGTVTVTSSQAANSPLVVPVTLTVTATGQIAAIDNAASLTAGQGAINTILSAFGAFPGCTGGAQVTVNGQTATVFYSSPTQINFLMSDVISGTGAVVVMCAGLTSPQFELPSAPVSPGIFTATMTGTGQAAIVNQDGTISTPSPAGTYIAVYVTGFGSLNPPSPDGLSRLTLPVTATIGGVNATVQYAGEAPGYTTGLQQINVFIPANTPAGPSVPLVLTVGGVSTQSGVTVGIQ